MQLYSRPAIGQLHTSGPMIGGQSGGQWTLPAAGTYLGNKGRTKILSPGDTSHKYTNTQIVRARDDDNCTAGAIFGSVTNSGQGKAFLELTFVFMRSGGWDDHWTWACQLRGDYPIHISIHHRVSRLMWSCIKKYVSCNPLISAAIKSKSHCQTFIRRTNFSRNLTSGLSWFFYYGLNFRMWKLNGFY